MSTELIIAIAVIAVLILIALLLALPRMRASAKQKKAERELQSRRETVAEQHRTEAAERERQADMAEQRARIAQQDAERQRAEASLRQEQASLHERGLADDELIDESERDRFAGVAGPNADVDRDTSATDDHTPIAPGGTGGTTAPDAGWTTDEREGAATGGEPGGASSVGGGTDTSAYETAEPGMSEYERGRDDERRERLTGEERDRHREG